VTAQVQGSARALLLDLDGTLLDTAPDMGAALNALRSECSLPPLAAATIRPHVSHGARALVQLAFAEASPARFERLRLRFLVLYAQVLSRDTVPFAGALDFLAELDRAGVPWGIVTNKPASLTGPLLRAQGLAARAACVVSGDTLAQRKPHPAPLLHAAGALRLAPAECLYVGDARRDIEAGRAAGMRTLIASYGYLEPGEDTSGWGADGELGSLAEARAFLALAP
jgi:N-acetyl-D-muramate 6-phosphate phosphatase